MKKSKYFFQKKVKRFFIPSISSCAEFPSGQHNKNSIDIAPALIYWQMIR